MRCSFECAQFALGRSWFSRRTRQDGADRAQISSVFRPLPLCAPDIWSADYLFQTPDNQAINRDTADQANVGANYGAVLIEIRPHDGERPANVRTALTNGKRAFLAGDGRSRGGRLLTDRERAFAAPLGGMGALTLIERTRVQAAALLSVRLEMARSAMASGSDDVSDEDIVRLVNGLGREISALDEIAARRVNPRQPSLAELLAADRHDRATA